MVSFLGLPPRSQTVFWSATGSTFLPVRIQTWLPESELVFQICEVNSFEDGIMAGGRTVDADYAVPNRMFFKGIHSEDGEADLHIIRTEKRHLATMSLAIQGI